MDEKQTRELQDRLFLLGELIHQLEVRSQRMLTDPKLAEGFNITMATLEETKKLLKPKQGSEQAPDNTLTTLNDRSEAFLDEFISRMNNRRDVTLLLSPADNIWLSLKAAREASGRPEPKL